MKKYQVFGMGNALVDMEVQVEEKFLKQMSIEKGLMTLVDEARQNEILSGLESNGFLHHTKLKRAAGGSAANTVVAASQMGAKTYYSCKVADDETGDFYAKDLSSEGVNSNQNMKRTEGITGKCLVLITPDAERSMNTYLGITSTYCKEQVILDDLKQSEYLYIEGYLLASPSGKEAVLWAKSKAREFGVKVALTFSDPGIVEHFRSAFDELIGDDGLDLIFANEMEAMAYCHADTYEKAAEGLKKYAKQFVVTRGEKGSYLYDGNDFSYIDPFQVDAVDANGAGDMYAGAFLYAITKGHDFKSAGNLASKASSCVVAKFGPRLSRENSLKIVKDLNL